MFRNRIAIRAVCLFATCSCMFSLRAEEAPVSFSKDIAPILAKSCEACHSAAEANGGYQVASYNLMFKAGDSEAAGVTAGMPEASELLARVSSDDESLRMPQDSDPLPAEQIELIKRWILEGAKYDAEDPNASLSSIIPKSTQPDPPENYRRPLPITAVAWSPDGQQLATSGYHEVNLWDGTSGAIVRRIRNVPQRVQSLAFSPDGTLLAVAGGTPGSFGEVKLFNPADGSLVKDLGSMSDLVNRAVFNPAGTKLAVGGSDRAIRVYDVASGKQEILIEDHADWVVGLAWSADGKHLASASRDKTSKLFNSENGESLATYSGHGDAVYDVGFSPDGKLVFSAGADKKIHAWSSEDAAKKSEVGGFSREVLTLAVSEDKVFTGSADKTVQQHRGAAPAHFKTYPGSTDSVFCISYNPATGRIAAGSFAGEVRVWNAEDGSPVTTFVASPGYTPPVASK